MSQTFVPGLVSVIIPVYNGGRFLVEAVESVLSQEHHQLEIIIVDDGSLDDSASVAQSFGPPVQYVYQTNAGAGSARNTGVDLSRGEFLAFLDADDIWSPGKLNAQLTRMREASDLDAVFGLVEHFSEADQPARLEVRVIQGAIGLTAGAMLIRRTAFLRVGAFNAELRMGEFIDWHIRAQDLGLHFETLTQVLLRRRIHNGNTSLLNARTRSDYLQVVRGALERRRSAQ